MEDRDIEQERQELLELKNNNISKELRQSIDQVSVFKKQPEIHVKISNLGAFDANIK